MIFKNALKELNHIPEISSEEIILEKLLGDGIKASHVDTVELVDGIYTFLPNGELIKVVIYKPIVNYRLFKQSGFEHYHITFCPELETADLNEYKTVYATKNKFFISIRQNRSDISIYRDKPLQICPHCLAKYNATFNRQYTAEEFSLESYSTKAFISKQDILFDTLPIERSSVFFNQWVCLKNRLFLTKGDYCSECNFSLKSGLFTTLHYENSHKTGLELPKIEQLCPVCHAKKEGHEKIKSDKIYKDFLTYKSMLIAAEAATSEKKWEAY